MKLEIRTITHKQRRIAIERDQTFGSSESTHVTIVLRLRCSAVQNISLPLANRRKPHQPECERKAMPRV